METSVTPDSSSHHDELKAELRAARELLAVKKARDGHSQAFTLPEGEMPAWSRCIGNRDN